MIKGIIFDVGGVLEEDTDEITFKRISEFLGKDYALVKKVFEETLPDLLIGEVNDEEFCKRISKKLKVDFGEEDWKRLLIDTYTQYGVPHKEVETVVTKLKNNRYKIAALSNTEPSTALFNRKRNRFKDFNIVVLSCEVGLRKPNPNIFKLVLDKLGLESNECVFIDDREINLPSARKLGIHTILYQNPEQLELELRQLGVNY